MPLSPINPRTLDIEDPVMGLIPYPGYGGDIELPPVREIGLSPDEWRAKNGMPPLPSATPVPPVQAPARHPAYVGPDRAAAMLADGAYEFSGPWGGDVAVDGGPNLTSAAQQEKDARAQADIDERHLRTIRAIEQAERRPMEEAIEAAKENAAYELVQSGTRPLYDVPGVAPTESQPGRPPIVGAFEQGPDGTITNRAPAMRLGEERRARQQLLPTMHREQQVAGLLAQFADAQNRINEDIQRWHTTQGKEGIAPTEGKAALDRAERLMAMMLQSASGGRDFSGFFRQGQQDPLTMLQNLGVQPQQRSED